MRVLLLSDVPDNWIVSRCADRMVKHMPDVHFSRGDYCCMSTREVMDGSAHVDMVHAMNWNFADHLPRALECKKPILLSIRSHRFPPRVREAALQVAAVHVVNPSLAAEFPDSHYIPDGLMVDPAPLRVGFAGKLGHYKGTDLIADACQQIGARFCPAVDLMPGEMFLWFRESIDVYCCASEAEGFSTPVMEALALNKPVISVRVGMPWFEKLPGITWVDRTVESIKAGLISHWPSRWLTPFEWPYVADRFKLLYESLI